MDKVANILKQVQDRFEGCNMQIQGHCIWVRRGRVLLHILDFNTLTYYFETNQLEKCLKELK